MRPPNSRSNIQLSLLFRKAEAGDLFSKLRDPSAGQGSRGFSGAARVAWASGSIIAAIRIHTLSRAVVRLGELEGHFDNVAASIYGSITATTGTSVIRLCARQRSISWWVLSCKTSTTNRGRAFRSYRLKQHHRLLARALCWQQRSHHLTLATIRECCSDDLHQPTRFAAQLRPSSPFRQH